MAFYSGFQPGFGLHSRIWPSPGKIFLKNQWRVFRQSL